MFLIQKDSSGKDKARLFLILKQFKCPLSVISSQYVEEHKTISETVLVHKILFFGYVLEDMQDPENVCLHVKVTVTNESHECQLWFL